MDKAAAIATQHGQSMKMDKRYPPLAFEEQAENDRARAAELFSDRKLSMYASLAG